MIKLPGSIFSKEIDETNGRVRSKAIPPFYPCGQAPVKDYTNTSDFSIFLA